MSAKVADLLARGGPVLLDFDGPICHLFAGLLASEVANDLLGLATSLGALQDDAIPCKDDPLQVLRWAGRVGNDDVLTAVEDALVAAEVTAVDSAQATPAAHTLVLSLYRAGRLVGIASNNSTASIQVYLRRYGLADAVTAVAGRKLYSPHRMKPDPSCLQVLTKRLAVQPSACVYIGDSMSDIEAGHAAGIAVIALANKPSKIGQFAAAKADAVVQSIAEVYAAMT